MLNDLWAFMILAGILWAVPGGNVAAVAQGVLGAAGEAVSLCFTMLGVISLWTGILKVGERAGLIDWLAGKMTPVLRFLFPGIPKGHPANRFIAVNMIANILGLGWAATPAGLRAMEELAGLEEERREQSKNTAPPAAASREMCTFLIINISSLQLIPVNMIAYRTQYGSRSPAAIVGPAIAATAVSTAVAVLFCRLMDRKDRSGR